VRRREEELRKDRHSCKTTIFTACRWNTLLKYTPGSGN
jgi:hypothetical protein